MEEKRDSSYKWLALAVVIVGTFMAILDTSIVNVAIPKMMNVFGVSTDQIQWVLTAYMLTMGSVIPLTGYLGDTFGTKKVYIWALAAFTLGSGLCGFAWSNSAMVVARVIQGLGGGMIMPVGMSIIYQVIPREERGMALGLWGIAAMVAPAVGPTLSGYIVENLNWRLIFTINLPVGAIAVLLAAILLKESPTKPGKGFDYLGVVSSVVGLVSILYVLGEGSTIDWNDFETVFLLLLGSFSLILFVVNELTHESPLLDLRIFKILPYTVSVLISSITTIALFGGVFLIPLYLQNLQGYTAMQTGIIMFPSAIATGIMMPVSGKLFDKFGPKLVVLPGILLLFLSNYELSKITLDTSAHTISMLLVLRGIGMGLAMMPATTAGMNAVPHELVNRASALNNVVRQVAGSLGISVLSTLLTHRQAVDFAGLAEQVSYFNPASSQLLKFVQGVFGQIGVSTGEAQALSATTIAGLVQKQAFMQAIDEAMLITTFVVLAAVPLSLMLKNTRAHHEPGQAAAIME